MRTIATIEEYDKRRLRITWEEGESFVLYKGELREYGIKEKAVLSNETIEKLMAALLLRAKKRGLALLTAKPYTEQKLREKLEDGEYPADIIDNTIAYLKSYRYIDDLQYAKDYIATYKASRSILRLKNDLQQKGIAKATIEDAFSELMESEEAFVDEASQIKRFLEKKHYDPATATREERNKLIASLQRKGYRFFVISKTLSIDEFE